MRTYQFPWLNDLIIERTLSLSCTDAIMKSLSVGGYLTGGFARRLAVALLAKNGIIRLDDGSLKWRNLRHSVFLGQGRSVDFGRNKWWKSEVDDIDMFFPTEEIALSVVSQVRSELPVLWDSPTPAGYGHEFVLGDNILQVITKVTGTPEEVTDGFDLANAKVWLDSSGIHVPDGWIEMEERRLLGIDRSDKLNLLWRVYKWFNKHGYTDFRTGDHDKYVDALLLAAQTAGGDGGWARWGRKVTLADVQKKGKHFMSTMPPAELLKMSLIYDDYDKVHITRKLAQKGQGS